MKISKPRLSIAHYGDEVFRNKQRLTPLTTSTSPPAVAANKLAVCELQLSFVESQRSTLGIATPKVKIKRLCFLISVI